jgi:signal transduction histidine kinase/CheY-like chemotaxis protein
MLSRNEPVKILVVDDEEIMLKLACDALRSQGHQVSGSSGALEALDKLKGGKFDFILTDIKMPEMDGMELIQSAHKIDPSMGAIFMTGYASLDTAKRAIQEGAYDYILKPFDLQEIRSAVARAIQKRDQNMKDGREKGLSQLFDLNRILYTAGDCKSLLKLSLEFALVQGRLRGGLILYWPASTGELLMLHTESPGQNLFDKVSIQVDEKLVAESSSVKDILQVERPDQYPLFTRLKDLVSDSSVAQVLPKADDAAILIPLRKAESTCGMIVLKKTSPGQELSEEDLKLLAILGIQTAISLENQTLLIETERSYRELQSLQEQIIGLEKMATQGRISAEIGHELNNYLTVIMGNFQILNIKIEKGEMQSLGKQLEPISTNLEKIKTFAEGLLDFSTLKAKKAECDINELIRKTLAFVKPQNVFKNITLLTELKTNLPRLSVDSGQIQQVLYNLLNNAADAMGKRKGEGGNITIGTNCRSEGQSLEIWVGDTGRGMSEEELRKVFTTGFTTKQSGHGMGLSICRKIIESHQGTIQVESKQDEGTTFRIRLPLR